MEDEALSIRSYVYAITGQIQKSESCLCIHVLSWSYILFIIKQSIILLVCFTLKKHNPHIWGTNYHSLYSTLFKNKSLATYYPFTVNSSWSIYKPLEAMLEQEEYGNIDSWEPLLAFWFPLVKPFGHKQAAGTMLYRGGVFRCSVTCKHCPPVLSGHKLMGQQQKCLKEAEPFYFSALHSALSPGKSTVMKHWERLFRQKLRAQPQYGRNAMDVLSTNFLKASVLVKLPVAEPYLLFAFVENQPSFFNFKTSNHLTLKKNEDSLIETVATWGSFVAQLSLL